jgi:hypothetical protein
MSRPFVFGIKWTRGWTWAESLEVHMNFVAIGTDHRMQNSEAGFEARLRSWLGRQFFDPLGVIAEEYAENIGDSVAQRLARERCLGWYNLNMTSEEKGSAGILAEQRSRPISTDTLAYQVPSDEIRERPWFEKLTRAGSGTTLVICGYVHFE